MNHLVNALIVLYAAAYCEATIFSWGGTAEAKETKPTGYLPILKVHKYNGIQINPIQGDPIYLPNEPNDSNNLEGRTTQLSQDQLQQLDLINRLATFLPSEDNLQEMDLSAALPYVDLISEDSLENFRNTIEVTKPKEKSKILKFIGFLKYLKEKKLKPFKYVASLGSSIVHKKKALLGLGAVSSTTLEPFTETPSAYNFAYNSYLATQKPFPASYFPPQSLSSAQSPSFSYYPQYPTYSINTQQKIPENTQNLPSADQFPPSYASITQQKRPTEIASELPTLSKSPFPAAPQLPQFSPNFQFPSTQYQQPAQRQYQFQYPLPAQSPNLAKNEITPASTYFLQNTNAIRQFDFRNQTEFPLTPAPKTEQFNQQQYSYPTNQIPSFSQPQQPFSLPKYQSNAGYSYANSNQGPANFYPTLSSDLAAAGSENVEKIEERVKPESSSKNDSESLKVNNGVASSTSTETSTLKSQHAGPKRTLLRAAVAPPTRTTVHPVYPILPKEDNSKGM